MRNWQRWNARKRRFEKASVGTVVGEKYRAPCNELSDSEREKLNDEFLKPYHADSARPPVAVDANSEVNDSQLVVESALLGARLLLSSDEHLRGMDFARLTIELQCRKTDVRLGRKERKRTKETKPKFGNLSFVFFRFFRQHSVPCLWANTPLVGARLRTSRARVWCVGRAGRCSRRDTLRYRLGKSARHGFVAVSNTIAVGASARAAGFVHLGDQTGFQQRARQGEGDGMRAFILETLAKPILTFQFFERLLS